MAACLFRSQCDNNILMYLPREAPQSGAVIGCHYEVPSPLSYLNKGKMIIYRLEVYTISVPEIGFL